MDIWGGENLEMSFRVWMCGGAVLIATCSHVGHVFRKSTPYTFPGGTSRIVNHNNARLAKVWMDDWKEFYFSINPGARSVDMGDISGSLASMGAALQQGAEGVAEFYICNFLFVNRKTTTAREFGL